MTLSPRSFKTATLAALIIVGGIANPAYVKAESLLEIYYKAVNNDPSIREAQANMYATMESKPQARANLLPQLDFSGSWQTSKSKGSRATAGVLPTSQNFSSDTDSLSWQFNVTQTLFNWDQFARMGRADKEVTQAQLDYGFAQQELMVRVTETYFNVLAARDTLVSEQAAKEAIERQLEQANRRYEVGLIAITDVQEARAGFDEAIAGEIVAKRDLANSREALREITGEYNQVLAKPAKEIPLLVPEPAIKDEWVKTAQEQNLAVLSAKIGADITRDDISISNGGYMPTLGLTGSYGNFETDTTSTQEIVGVENTTVLNNDQTNKSIGIQLNVPLFAGLGTTSAVKESVYRHRAAKENFEKVVRQTERETRDAYYGVESEISRVKALRQSRKSSEVALEATEAGYEVGTRTTVDVLDARRSLFLAQTNYARSRYDYIVNVIKLKQAAGTLNPDDLAMINSWLERESEVLDINPASSESDTE